MVPVIKAFQPSIRCTVTLLILQLVTVEPLGSMIGRTWLLLYVINIGLGNRT